MPIVNIVLGAVLLLFGRSLYWVFVAVVGFLVGSELAAQVFTDQPVWLQLVAASAVGVIGALLSMLAQRVAFALGGLCAGGYLVAQALPGRPDPIVWIVVGAVIGAVLAAMLMDWAIIVLSSLAGAAAIVAPLELQPTPSGGLFVVLALFGIFVQGKRMARSRAHHAAHQKHDAD